MSDQKKLSCPKIVRGQKQLTEEQKAYAQRFAQERIASMLSTAAINEAEAEEHLRQVYRVAGLEPVPVRWFDSPVAFVLARWQVSNHVSGHVHDHAYAKIEAQVRDQVRDQVGTQLRTQIDHQVEAQVWGQIWSLVGTQVEAQVWTYVRAQVDQVGVRVWGQVWSQIWGQTWPPVGAQVEASVLSYHKANGQSLYRFLHEIFEPNDLIHLALFSEMVSGFHLGGEEAWLVRKPIRLERDEQGRLHSASGMAMQYRDGWGFYAWHGVHCSEKIILNPERLTRQDWMEESNLELRRVIQERLGNDRFVELVGGTIIDRGKRGDLVSVALLDDPEREARFVHVRCPSTARHYYLRVPPTITRADEAVAWTFSLEEGDYQPIQET